MDVQLTKILMFLEMTIVVVTILNIFLIQIFVQGKNVIDLSKIVEQSNEGYRVKFTEDLYQDLVYFVKSSALSSCITHYGLNPGFTLNNGGCPNHIQFCHNYTINPNMDNTHIVTVLAAKKGGIGTGYIMVDHNKETIIVAFRSSTTSEDWFSNFAIQPTEYSPISKKEYWELVKNGRLSFCKDCQIHKGLSKFKESLGGEFLDKIEYTLKNYPSFKIVITGHSLGAALASMVGIELKLKGYQPLVLTYATPKIFNSNLKDWVNELFESVKVHDDIIQSRKVKTERGYFRVIHKNDYIQSVPPFYKAAGLEIFINKISLPHNLEDLEYYGMATNKFPLIRNANSISGFVDQFLRTYEHTSYFIYLKGCNYF